MKRKSASPKIEISRLAEKKHAPFFSPTKEFPSLALKPKRFPNIFSLKKHHLGNLGVISFFFFGGGVLRFFTCVFQNFQLFGFSRMLKLYTKRWVTLMMLLQHLWCHGLGSGSLRLVGKRDEHDGKYKDLYVTAPEN